MRSDERRETLQNFLHAIARWMIINRTPEEIRDDLVKHYTPAGREYMIAAIIDEYHAMCGSR